MEGLERKRIVKLLCPCVSSKTLLQIIAWEDQKLDLGSISRAFGIDPNTLKLNGHFISRGVDFVASSVTWRSLIGFFSARGLSTGASDSDALVVHGKLSKIGCKRSHEPPGTGITEQGYTRDNKRAQLDDGRLITSDYLKENISGPNDVAEHNSDGPDQLHLKRKLCLEDASHFKRLKSAETVSDEASNICFPDPHGRNCGASTIGRFSCSFMSKNIKRMRDDEIVATAPLKKNR